MQWRYDILAVSESYDYTKAVERTNSCAWTKLFVQIPFPSREGGVWGRDYTRRSRVLYLPSRHAPSVIFPVVHERNRCFNWFIVVALRLEMRFLADQPLRFPVSI